MSASNPRILIVDDIADNRAILARRLVRREFDIVEADGGCAALDLIGQQQFDLVLLDIMMPDLDGIEVLKRIRAKYSPSALPVIMVTAHAESSDTVTALTLGANDYVTKPVDFPVALARIQAQIARKQAEDALRSAKEQLEHHVEVRTAELSRANAQLETEIEERRRSEAQMEYMAHHDSLTGLANRTLFNDRLAQALTSARRNNRAISVLCLDLDHFKEINDTLGHPVGDKLLQMVAQRIVSTVRASDTVARLGGDEFAIVQTDVGTPESAALLAKRLLEVFETPIELGAESISTRLSIGAAKFPQDADTADDLLKAADIALYQAKTEGRGTFTCFDQGMNAALESRRAFERDLRQALAKHEFELHYQPLVSLETQTILGCEALIRWIHPQRGFVSPADFIPLAETTGLIVDIGEWVLRTACAEATHWPNGMKVAVNLSPVQFARPGLVETVSRALSDTGLDPTRLELEITESMLLGDNDAVLRSLEALKSLGIQIAMDDFGTGYSSLSYLQKFPFDKIKVDRSFVANLGESEESVAIIRAVIGLASGLGMTTLAEGVETEHQAGSLLAEGCAQAQGYFFSRPQPAAAIRALLSDLGEIGLRTNEGQAKAA